MNELPTASVLRELVARGLIAAQPAAQPWPGGNADRRDLAERTSWRINLPDGRPARLIVGPDLADLNGRHCAIAQACPALIPALLFYQRFTHREAFAEEFFEGNPLDVAVRESPVQAVDAFTRVCAGLAATSRPSSEPTRLAEWQAWTNSVEALNIWTALELPLLRHVIWPRLYPLLGTTPPVLRWTNGDFTSENILLNRHGEPRLIDCEFAHETHFFNEDAVRFYTLSAAARRSPELFSPVLPMPGPAWHLFFWLRQTGLEASHNTPAYLARMLPMRLAVIRRLAEQILGCDLNGWSVDAAPVQFRLEAAKWEQTATTALRLAGWCHLPGARSLDAIVVTERDRLLAAGAPSPRPDVQAYFADATNALSSGFSLAIPVHEPEATLVVSALADDGSLLPFHSFRACDLPDRGPWVEDYTRWTKLYDPDPPASPPDPAGPLFSVLLPVYDPPPEFLRQCLESVRRQYYPRWELCIVDDGSTDGTIRQLLQEQAASDRRIRVQHRPANGGIARATNDALAAARGEFSVLLDHDDLLRPHALAEFAARLQRESDLDLIYSDEDKITAEGVRVESFLKPDYSPENLLGVMYLGHALCVRTAVARAAGGFDSAFDGVQDYEFSLRVTEHTKRIGHVPRMLYHWRQSPGSSALHANVKGNIDEMQAAAVQAHLTRRGRTEQVIACGHHRVRLGATSSPAVEMIRPTSGEEPVAALRRMVDSIRTDVLVLLCHEPHHTSENWLRELAAVASLADSGFVAPLLLSHDGRVLESGRTVGPEGAIPLMRGFEPGGDGYIGSLLCTREVAAVSPACCAIQRQLAQAALATAPVGESWLEFCLRLRTRGQYHRVCPTARVQLDHSWLHRFEPGEIVGASDPFFNPHFDRRRADYSLARPPEHYLNVHWHLDAPPASRLPNGCLCLRGWCFATGGRSMRALRLGCGDVMLFGVAGLTRPDVKAAIPAAPNDNTGFEIRVTLPAGRHILSLEAGWADGTWSQLMTHSVDVKRRLLPRWLGGGDASELMSHQMPLHAIYPPRAVRWEPFPSPRVTTTSRPQISIVTPSYEQARFLDETIRSVLEQAAVTREYVVQDGGSTDGSVEIIRRHTARLRAWESAADGGQTDAILRGFAKTKGAPDDLMAWINSDDFYLPGALAFVADYFAGHPEVDVLYGHRLLVDEGSREIGRWFLPRHDRDVLRLNDFVPQETLFWRRRAWDKVGGLDTSFQFAMDWDLLLRFEDAGAQIVHVPQFLACFRIHPAQKTSVAMPGIGRKEITLLRERSRDRPFPRQETGNDRRLIRYLRSSAFIEFMWRLGIRPG